MRRQTYTYLVTDFEWKMGEDTFVGKESNIYSYTPTRVATPFPSHGKKFKMLNLKTNQWRFFYLIKDKPLVWEYETKRYDGKKIKCIIYKIAHPIMIKYDYPDRILITVNDGSKYEIGPNDWNDSHIQIIKHGIQGKTNRRRILGNRKRFTPRYKTTRYFKHRK
tara:strand:- start:1208 stop:1699 length:492 start_codon:yes stop_codon:yes gene_type:complete